ncbi:MAG TPA: tRNA 2-thiouridine(34) synthase MnmA [Sphaerochaeta sp.]|mgnify:FL=1|nr:tRNA 2-thiouridine(34) synthase MnmA [Sphaerochaeta sp.]
MRVLLGMSGGIDSSAAAYILKNQGHEVIGVTMTIWSNRAHLQRPVDSVSCFAPDKSEDIERIKELCARLGIEHHTLELSDRFEEEVLSNFKDEYLDGKTPNPCVWCNQRIKFGAMVEYAKKSGLVFDKFATGHYARIVHTGKRWAVGKAKDEKKDQSYFLYRLSQEQLKTILFPLGELAKDEVRVILKEHGHVSDDQEESQDFYDGPYTDLLEVEDKEGAIITRDGRILGTHKGIWHYTIGQRRGLGIAAERPLYVLELRASTNEVVVGFVDETVQHQVEATDVVFGSVAMIEGEVEVEAKIRSVGRPKKAIARRKEDGSIVAFFPEGVNAATPGQSLVLYKDDLVLAGGIITHAR